jgi:predicted 3-demethylubiquinone-9 3-methyltransferase (glyoxalase superfamily)
VKNITDINNLLPPMTTNSNEFPRIYPCVWIDQKTGNVDAALKYYQDIFPNLKILNKQNFGNKEDLPEFLQDNAGKTMYVEVEMLGNRLMLLTGAENIFPRSGFISLILITSDQQETDYYWNKITAEGAESECGWCSDKFGVNWQVTPKVLMEILSNGTDEEKVFANKAIFDMKKIVIENLKLPKDIK